MMRFGVAALVLIAAYVFATGCAKRSEAIVRERTPATSQPAATAPAWSPSDVVVYRRTGGFLGTDDTVMIWPDGRLSVSGMLMPCIERQLDAGELSRFWSSFHDWDHVVSAGRSAAMDAFTHTLTYHGKTVSADDVSMSLEMRRIIDCIDAIRAKSTVQAE